MNSKRFLINIQFLGFRYHGVQKQENFQTIQGRIESALIKVFGGIKFQTRFASRTDARVSALDTYFLLMFEENQNLQKVEAGLINLPGDLKILEIKPVDDRFTMLKAVKEKEYHYFFSSGPNSHHPFAAPFMTHLIEELNIEEMKKGALLFKGIHHFHNYAYKPKTGQNFMREIFNCEIVENDFFTASFFPAQSFVLKIRAKSFMRGQVRLIMGTLFRLGKNEISLSEIQDSLTSENPRFVKWMAPSSGLILHKTLLE